MNAVMTVIKKEWAEVRRNKLVLSVVLFVPLLMTAIPLVMLALCVPLAGLAAALLRRAAGRPELWGKR